MPASATRKPRLTLKLVAVLTQYRENLEGGDPNMGHVSAADFAKLLAAGLVEPAYAPDGSRLYARAHVPTAAGLAALDAVTATCAPPPSAKTHEAWLRAAPRATTGRSLFMNVVAAKGGA